MAHKSVTEPKMFKKNLSSPLNGIRRCSHLSAALVTVALTFVCGCSTVVREMQRSEAQSASSTANIAGQEISVSAQMWLEGAKDAGKGDVHGQIRVAAEPGPMPATVDLYHFQIITKDWRRGLGNYYRGKDGKWRKAGRGGGTPLDVTIAREAKQIALNFDFSGWKDKPQPFDVSVSFSDAAGKRHVLLASNVVAEAR